MSKIDSVPLTPVQETENVEEKPEQPPTIVTSEPKDSFNPFELKRASSPDEYEVC